MDSSVAYKIGFLQFLFSSEIQQDVVNLCPAQAQLAEE